MMLRQPMHKYAFVPPVEVPDRQWPGKTITAPPIWLSTDLRDGNQALFEPMSGVQKLQMFQLLCAIGFKEIEIGFPSASQIEFDFVRQLIEGGHIPSDVTIAVLTPARAALIERTMQSLSGVRRAIVHVYHATAPLFRERVFGMTQQQVMAMACDAVGLIQCLSRAQPDTEWVLEYSPEAFNATEPVFAQEICDAVTAHWGATAAHPVIINLPATVECATPNVYADQIEWMHRHLARREGIVLSVHPHNDRGTAVAAAELAMLAGADRVEGCLFGNGERTGNVDLVTLALNLYAQGVSPGLDFSDMQAVVQTCTSITRLPVHPRHPYAGDLVFTAFSGSHQDAIKKGMAAQQLGKSWQVPYLPIDPADVGRSYASVIRVNSQSGKGGIAWMLEHAYGVRLPRRLQIEFASHVQQHLDAHGKEVNAQELWGLFAQIYLQAELPYCYVSHTLYGSGGMQGVRLIVRYAGVEQELCGEGNGPIDAAVNALLAAGVKVEVCGFEEQSMGAGADALACAYVEARQKAHAQTCFGVGMDANTVTAALKALFGAVNNLLCVELRKTCISLNGTNGAEVL